MTSITKSSLPLLVKVCASSGPKMKASPVSIGVLPWSPLARGRLAREASERSFRSERDEYARNLYDKTQDADRAVIDRVGKTAARRGVPRAQVALAWLLQRPAVTAPIIGATKLQHLEDAVGALSVSLTGEEIAALEEPYVPHRIVGFS